VDVRDVADFELGAVSFSYSLHCGDTLRAQFEHLLGVEKKPPALFREDHGIVGTIEQPHAELVLEISHLARERRLSEPESLSGFGKAQHFRDGDEITEVTEFHKTHCGLVARLSCAWII
jgi:hypothetical protein